MLAQDTTRFRDTYQTSKHQPIIKAEIILPSSDSNAGSGKDPRQRQHHNCDVQKRHTLTGNGSHAVGTGGSIERETKDKKELGQGSKDANVLGGACMIQDSIYPAKSRTNPTMDYRTKRVAIISGVNLD